MGAASASLHLFLLESLSKCQTHALSAVHDASSLWAAHPLSGLPQPTSDKVRAIITNAYLMLVFLLLISLVTPAGTEPVTCRLGILTLFVISVGVLRSACRILPQNSPCELLPKTAQKTR